MNAKELNDALRKLGLSQGEAAKLFGVGLRTMARWCAEGGVPVSTAVLVRLLVAGTITANLVEEIRDETRK